MVGSSIPAAAVEQLHDKIMPLAVGLHRCDRLLATLQQYKANVGDEVKGAVRDVVQQVLPLLLSAAGDVSSAAPQQQIAAEAQLSEQLQVTLTGLSCSQLTRNCLVVSSYPVIKDMRQCGPANLLQLSALCQRPGHLSQHYYCTTVSQHGCHPGLSLCCCHLSLQLLHHGSFMVLLYAAARVIYSCVDHAVCVGRLLENILEAVSTPAR